jgi:hypothetical protein
MNMKREKRYTYHQWTDFLVCGDTLGVRSPPYQLQKAIATGLVKELDGGWYRVDKKRLRRHVKFNRKQKQK